MTTVIRGVEVKSDGCGRRAVVVAKGLMPKEAEALNCMFGESLSFKPNKEEDVVEIVSTTSDHTAVHIAAELEDMGFPWKNPKNLGLQVHSSRPSIIRAMA